MATQGMAIVPDDPNRLRRRTTGIPPISGPVTPGGPGNLPISGPISPTGPGNLLPSGPMTPGGNPWQGGEGGPPVLPRPVNSSGPGSGNLPSGGRLQMATMQNAAANGIAPGSNVQPGAGYSGPEPIEGSAPSMATSASAPGAYDLEKMRKGWAYGGGGFASQTSEAELDKFLADNASGFSAGVTRKGDKLYDPSGRFMFDAIGNLKGGDPSKFTRIALDNIDSSGKPRSGKPPKGKGPISPPGMNPDDIQRSLKPSGGAGGPTTPIGPTNTGGLGSESKGLYDLLMSRAKQSENIDPNDPIIKGQTDAFRAEGTQARRDFLAGQAEAAGPYGNQRSEERRSAERLGQSTGAFQAQAMQQELGAKRAQIESALSGAAGFLTEQQRMDLQNQLTRLQLAQQESQFGRNLKQQGSQFDRNLGWQKDQFGRNLDWQKESFGRGLGQRAYEFDTSRFDDLFG